MPFGDRYFKLFSTSKPCKQSRISWLSVNGEEVKVIVEASEDSAQIIASKIAACGSKFMRPSFHHWRKDLPLQSHSNSSHLCNGKAAINHMITPCLNSSFELRKVFGKFILSDITHHISNVVEVSPLGIMWRRGRSVSLVSIHIGWCDFRKISCSFCEFWCGSNLEIVLRENIGHRSSSIEFHRSFLEEFLHQIKEIVILININSWILDDEAAIFFESLSNSFAILCVVSWFCEEVLDIYDGDGEGGAKKTAQSVES